MTDIMPTGFMMPFLKQYCYNILSAIGCVESLEFSNYQGF